MKIPDAYRPRPGPGPCGDVFTYDCPRLGHDPHVVRCRRPRGHKNPIDSHYNAHISDPLVPPCDHSAYILWLDRDGEKS